MSDEIGKLLPEIVARALELKDPQQREQYLARACGGDAGLRQQVEAMLAAQPETGGPRPHTLEVKPEPLFGEGPGTIIGRYKLLQEIGEGGFGTVFMAEQLEPVQRTVALKIIKAGMDTREVIARFEAERQALALMDHPNIARVLDGGATESGRPYFVMELVKGIRITDYCDQHNLTTEERLDLFIKVCHAVQHAHQKGIIHRDLKPSNVIVTLQDGDAVPKVIDFGIAKATGKRLTDKTLFTRYEQMIGTPAYMSPEQAQMSGLDIDTRTDVYALGVLLYELLTGVTPFDKETLANASFDEVRRLIQETEPSKPSTRLYGLGEKLTDVARHRQLEPGVLRRSVRGDLDWIAMKALEKDRRRRYETANELAEDIQRHLQHHPVLAGPPSTVYRARKFVRRHRVGVAMGAAVTLALLLGLSFALAGFQRAREERDRAVKAETATRRERDRALVAEEQMRRERDRAVQAEAETRGMVELFSDKMLADDEMIGLLQTAARLGQQRLGPTNPATLGFLSPLARNLGRLGAWTNALELYLALIDADPGDSDSWQRGHAAALAVPQRELSRQLRQGMVTRFAASPDLTNRLRLAQALLLPPDDRVHLEAALASAAYAVQTRPSDLLGRTIQGMAEYRRGNWSEALKWLREPEGTDDPGLAAIASSFGAMARHQAGQPVDAREALERASRQLRLPLQMGQLLAKDWHQIVYAFVSRAEAERLILGREVSPPVTAEFLAAAREKWRSVRALLLQGEAFARQGSWKASRDAYVQALDHPAFDWGPAEGESTIGCLSLHMGTAFVRAGDRTNYARLCELLLAMHPEKQDRYTVRVDRYAKTCFLNSSSLPVGVRQAALQLARFAAARKDEKSGWDYQTAGIAEYYAGQPEQALELLLQAEKDPHVVLKGIAMVFRGMVLHKLGHSQEAAGALQVAEDLLREPLQTRPAGYFWWDFEQANLALDEARSLRLKPRP